MKMIFMALLSLPVMAGNGELLLDASCKITCSFEKGSIYTQGGEHKLKDYKTIYLDLEALTREQLDHQTSQSFQLNHCQKILGGKAWSDKIDCLIFKH